MSATFAKLRSGDWGAKIVGRRPVEGQELVLERKDGQRVPKRIEKVIWSSEDGREHLCALASDDPAEPTVAAATTTTPTRERRGALKAKERYECSECGDFVMPGTTCWETGARH